MENNTNHKYKILWFDDDFAPKSDKENYGENVTRTEFQEDVEAAVDYGLEVIGVYNIEQFRKQIESHCAFQAVIFDLKGLDENDVFNDMVMPEAFKLVQSIPNIEIFVYSANINSETFKITLDELKKKQHVFNKGLMVDPLFERIIEVLDKKLHFYKDHQDCLYLFNNGYLDTQRNKSVMDELLENYSQKNTLYSPYNNMRQILENMLYHLESIGLIKPLGAKDTEGDRFNPLMRCLAEGYHNKTNDNSGKIERDFSKPIVPFELCRREFKYTLSFLGNITNRYSHFLKENPDYLQRNDADGCNGFIQESAYQAFWAAMRWYYSFAVAFENCGRNLNKLYELNKPQKKCISLILEYDASRNKYHCGEYFVKYSDVRDLNLSVGDEIEILESDTNTIEVLNNIYPMYAKCIRKK